MSDHSLREYARLVFRLWSKQIAGPIAAVAAILLPIVSLAVHSTRFAATLFGVAPLLVAIILIWPAQYQVWKEERDNRRTEERKNSLPQIMGELQGFEIKTIRRGVEEDFNLGFLVTFSLSVRNQRSVSTNITRLELDGSSMKTPTAFTNVVLLEPARIPLDPPRSSLDVELKRGIEVHMIGTAQLDPLNIAIGSRKQIDLTGLRASLVDGFGNVHPLQIDGH